jgi:hypothetical protein
MASNPENTLLKDQVSILNYNFWPNSKTKKSRFLKKSIVVRIKSENNYFSLQAFIGGVWTQAKSGETFLVK